VRQVTAKQRYARALAAVTAWCRKHRHLPIPEQHTQLVAKMRGHYAYYGIAGNTRRLSWYALPGQKDLAEVAVATGSWERAQLEPLQRTP
jgi:hypothetical protein